MRITREQLESQNRMYSEQNGILLQAVQALANDQVQWFLRATTTERVSYKFGVSNLTGGLGGIVYVRYQTPTQAPSTNVYTLDAFTDWARLISVDSPEWDAFTRANNKALGLRHDAYELERNGHQVESTEIPA